MITNLDYTVTEKTSVSVYRKIFFLLLLLCYHNRYHGLYSMNYASRSFQVPSIHSGTCISWNLDVKISSRTVTEKGELMKELVSCVTPPIKSFRQFFRIIFYGYIISIVKMKFLTKLWRNNKHLSCFQLYIYIYSVNLTIRRKMKIFSSYYKESYSSVFSGNATNISTTALS